MQTADVNTKHFHKSGTNRKVNKLKLLTNCYFDLSAFNFDSVLKRYLNIVFGAGLWSVVLEDFLFETGSRTTSSGPGRTMDLVPTAFPDSQKKHHFVPCLVPKP